MDMWLEAISSARVSPAAGSAATLAGALSVALLIKLARLEGPSGFPDHEWLLDELIAARVQLVALAERDAQALAAWPRSAQQDSDGSGEGDVVEALVSVPRQGAELCSQILLKARPLLGHVRAVAQPDAQVAVQLLQTCQRALESLVEANLALFPDLS